MDRRIRLDDLHLPDNPPSASTTIVYSILGVYAIHQLLAYYDYPILSPQELLWNALVYLTPVRLLLDAEKRQELKTNNMLSQTHAAKGEAMRQMLGLGGGALTHKLSGGEGVMRRMSMFSTNDAPATNAPPGLGNWDNSCYQNSVLQGLSSLASLKSYLEMMSSRGEDAGSTSTSLRETVAKLNDASNNGRQLWTPAKLKSMSSWQQQDAQEYLSKIMDELDKEAAKNVAAEKADYGLEAAVQDTEVETKEHEAEASVQSLQCNPMEGMLAQRVACTRCGFSEGLSMIPFNCLTVPLGPADAYELDDCLDEYTKLEEISEVDCAKCTLLRAEGQLRQMLPVAEPNADDAAVTVTEGKTKQVFSLPPELRVLAAKRLEAIQHALDEDDFSDKTLNEACQIPKKARVSSTKTRQAVVGRAPQSLVVHVNRSVFDELTGVQRKNYASVWYPMVLDLSAWMLGEHVEQRATRSMLAENNDAGCLYRLKAMVTHYGRHENGHYICYRRHPVPPAHDAEIGDSEAMLSVEENWWRLSDEDVSPVSEETLLAQGGVFMLFYERDDVPEQPPLAPEQAQIVATASDLDNILADAEPKKLKADAALLGQAAAVPLPPEDAPDPNDVYPASSAPATANSCAPSTAETAAMVPRPTPPLMRTAHGRQASRQGSRSESGFGNAFRPMAAT